MFCKEYFGEGEGGFKWLLLSDFNFSKCFYCIGWIMFNFVFEVFVFEDGDIKDEDGDIEFFVMLIVEKVFEVINGKIVKDE